MNKMKISHFILLILIVFYTKENSSAQELKTCEISIDNILSNLNDSIIGNDLEVTFGNNTMFSWDGLATIIKSSNNYQKINFWTVDPILTETDTFIYNKVLIASIDVNLKTCQIKKEIYAGEFLSKSTKKLIKEYKINKELYNNGKKINSQHSNENYLLRYCWDLTLASLNGNKKALKLLLDLGIDFELFRNGLDHEDYYFNKNMVLDLFICDRSEKEKLEFENLSRIRY
jgi:hypothetical protein